MRSSLKESARKNDNQFFTLWLMGPTSSGKTTLGHVLLERLRSRGVPVIHYDGDEVRGFFGSDLGFDEKDRLRVVMTLVHLALKASGASLNVIISALTANKDARKYVNENIKDVIIGYIECPIEICVKRDPKKLYKRAAVGEINTLIGVNSKYVPPKEPDIILESEKYSISCLVDSLEQYLRNKGYFI